MKQIINKKLYDTETASLVCEYCNGYGSNDFNYLYERLYKKKTGEFFLYGEGGPKSKYSKKKGNWYCDGESIIPYTEEDAQEFVEKHGSVETYEELFGVVPE